VTLVSAHIDHENGLDGVDAEHFLDWYHTVQDMLESRALQLSVGLRDLACTLLTAVVGPSFGLFAQVGDGAIVNLQDNHYVPVFWPDTGEYANVTNFITTPDMQKFFHFESRDDVSELAIFSDGLQSLALYFAEKSAHQPFFESMFCQLRVSASGEDLNVDLCAFLDSTPVNERTDDDKTLVLVTRLS